MGLAELQGNSVLGRPVRWLRRRRAVRRYLKALSFEIATSAADDPDVEARAAARVDRLYKEAAALLVERWDVMARELDRKIEGVADEVRRLRQEMDGRSGPAPP
jgi:hypothetical protein